MLHMQGRESDEGGTQHTVVQNIEEKSASCSCKHIRLGVLCKHIFHVFKDMQLERIPDKYIVSRWTRSACLKPIFQINGSIVDQTTDIEGIKLIINHMWGDLYTCFQIEEGNIERLIELRGALTKQKHKFQQVLVEGSGQTVKEIIVENYCGLWDHHTRRQHCFGTNASKEQGKW